jgi:hypothetical protein
MPRSKFTPSQNNGGIGGSGVYGHFGSVVNCKSEDNSMYCNFVKFFNVLIMFCVIISIIYIIYLFTSPYLSKKKYKYK